MNSDLDFILDEPGSVESILNKIVVMALPRASDVKHMNAVDAVMRTRRREVEEIVSELRSACSEKSDDDLERFCRHTQLCSAISDIAAMLHGKPQCHMGGCMLPALPWPCEHGFCWGCHEVGSVCGEAP